jgi:hypothetical protein
MRNLFSEKHRDSIASVDFQKREPNFLFNSQRRPIQGKSGIDSDDSVELQNNPNSPIGGFHDDKSLMKALEKNYFDLHE